MCVPGVESCLWGAVHRPLPPAGTDEESFCHKGQRKIITFDASVCLHLWLQCFVLFTFCLHFRVDCRSLLWKTRWRRGWWRSRGRSRACWRRPSAPRAARGRHHGSMTSNSCWSCLTSEDECYRVFTAVTEVESVDHFVINSVRLCARVRVELVTFWRLISYSHYFFFLPNFSEIPVVNRVTWRTIVESIVVEQYRLLLINAIKTLYRHNLFTAVRRFSNTGQPSAVLVNLVHLKSGFRYFSSLLKT